MYKNISLIFISVFIFSCSEPVEEIESDSFLNIAGARVGLASQQPIDWDFQALDPYMNMDPALSASRVPLFGDLHVHTTYSFDAYIFGTLATPDDAYEFAKGKSIKHPAGFDVSLDRPLDFYGVTDHGTFLGHVEEAATPGTVYYDAPSSAPQLPSYRSYVEEHGAYDIWKCPQSRQESSRRLSAVDWGRIVSAGKGNGRH